MADALGLPGGPAFPISIPGVGDDGCAGMSLRDWFAGQAIAGGLARDALREYELDALFGKHRTGITRAEILAADAYRIADAMLSRACSKDAKDAP